MTNLQSAQRELRRGVLVNLLGLLGKLAAPLFLIAMTRLYGPDAMGIFLTALVLVEMSAAFLTAGFQDGALLFVARHHGEEGGRERLLQAVANALGWSVLVCAALIPAAFLVVPCWTGSRFDYAPELDQALQVMALGLPFFAAERVLITATQGLRIMTWEALFAGGLRPTLLVAAALGLWWWQPSALGLATAWTGANVLLGVLALGVWRRCFGFEGLRDALWPLRWNVPLLRFALPQNVNMAVSQFMTGVDVVMLGAAGLPAGAIAFYAAGSQIVRNLRVIKVTYAQAWNPHVPGFLRREDRSGLASLTADTMRALTWWVLAAVGVVALLRDDLLRIVHPTFAGDTTFLLALLALPWLVCVFGLHQNLLTMSGRSALNLVNHLLAVLLNVGLNLWWIPKFGLVGAALASVCATVVLTALQVVQARAWLGVRVPLAPLALPHAAALGAWCMVSVVGSLGADTLLNRLACAALWLGLVGGAWWMAVRLDKRRLSPAG